MSALPGTDALERLVALRHDLHRHPEILYETHRTAGLVAGHLREMGCDEVVEGIGRTGVVGVIRGTGEGGMIGLRADMDALPIGEETNLPYASSHAGRMHACGHDGHVTMLLGAARELATHRAFSGTVVVIFQPAEEGGAGALAMIQDGLLDRFPLDEIYALHNLPGLPVGQFAATAGPAMGSVDEVRLVVEGRGGHAAMPHEAADPVFAAAALVCAAQGVVARNIDPLQSAVVSLTTIAGGTAFNVIPSEVTVGGTVRTLDEGVRERIEARLGAIAAAIGTAHEVEVRLDYIRHYPVTRNHPAQTAHAVAAARRVAGEAGVDAELPAWMGGEDFAFFLQEVPGAIIWAGNGPSAGLHQPAYDFDDQGIPHGIAFFTRIVADRLPLAGGRSARQQRTREPFMFELDHMAVTAPTLEEGVATVEEALGVSLSSGGRHATMGTWNRLLGLGEGFYLEVIAPDPEGVKPAQPRWFGLDEVRKVSLGNWIVRTGAIDEALGALPRTVGPATPIARGDLEWRITIPPTGRLPFDDCFPAIIQWVAGLHPSARLPDVGCRLRRLVVSHPEASALRSLLALADPRLQIEPGSPGLRAEIETPHGTRVLG